MIIPRAHAGFYGQLADPPRCACTVPTVLSQRKIAPSTVTLPQKTQPVLVSLSSSLRLPIPGVVTLPAGELVGSAPAIQGLSQPRHKKGRFLRLPEPVRETKR